MHIYTRAEPKCAFCEHAKFLLHSKGIEHTETVVGQDITLEEFQRKFPMARTFPLVIDAGHTIGGYNELKEHVKNGEMVKFLTEDSLGL